MKKTKTERLRAVGATNGDWHEPSVYAPPGLGFTHTGDVRSKMHLARYDAPNPALCGVGVPDSGSEQTLEALVERELCHRCLLALERQNSS